MSGFGNDILKRERFAKNLTDILKNSESHLINDNKSLVIALDSPWGTGKTTFLNEWKEMLKGEKFKILHYNAWESDYSEDALMPIINKIYDQESSQKNREKLKEKTVNLLKYVGKSITKKIIAEKFGNEFQEILSSITEHSLSTEKINEILRENPSNKYFDDFLEFKGVKDDFIEFLQQLSNGKKIIFFIDELDRCRPTFSIETLEIIKHFFNINNFIFIIALDMEQLSHSVKTIYGQDMDTCGYLRRFFDLHFKIPKPRIIDYVKFVLENNDLIYLKEPWFINDISNIFDKLNLSLREINSILKNYKLVLDTSLRPYKEMGMQENDYPVLEVFLYLITLKYKEPDYYNIILCKKFILEGNSLGNNDKTIVIPKNICEPTEKVKEFLQLISCGNNDKLLKDFPIDWPENLYPYLGFKISNASKVNKYIEEQIEIFNYIAN
ncbi:KAP family P-loop NTPase fold protein [Clostridium sp.]|jgi:hypothetical protein|uniref:KAP family P-loop NTPase fold protein n=1 Tax=Clostridium sp. TaxID=1506 RepID=UPI003EE88CCD